MHILNVAEKPSVAKSLSEAFSLISSQTSQRRNGRSTYNPVFSIDNVPFPFNNFHSHKMCVTSLLGHIYENDFDASLKNWHSCDPADLLYPDRTQITNALNPKFKDIESEIKSNIARTNHGNNNKCQGVILWLDCDMEGEAIADEVRQICLSVNARLIIKRARFSSTSIQEIKRALDSVDNCVVNENQVDAVQARSEIDLRLGSCFTRFMTLRLREKFDFSGDESSDIVSYGPCQFPTLGFVVERWARIEVFIPEDFYKIVLRLSYNNKMINFNWSRTQLYDRSICLGLFEAACEELEEGGGKVISNQGRHSTRRKPTPLATVEMQKRCSKFYRIGSEDTMAAAEKLYQEGFITYPRTETEKFSHEFDLRGVVEGFRGTNAFGNFATKILDQGGFSRPRDGVNDDKAHPPISPVKAVDPSSIHDPTQQKVYELVCKHFLACCAKDAVGQLTTMVVRLGIEDFTAKGLMITERNWLEVYSPQEKWYAGTGELPNWQPGHRFSPTVFNMEGGTTRPPDLINEVELISEMDRHKIGTDATIASHIKTIQDRKYAIKDNNQRFRPTDLGIALVEGYNSMGYQLNKPHLRAKMEHSVQDVASGRKTKNKFVTATMKEMQECFAVVKNEAHKLDRAMTKRFGTRGANYSVKERDFATCGRCGDLMDLKENGGNGGKNDMVLFCKTCTTDQSYNLPKATKVKALESACPKDNFQFVEIKDGNKDAYKICPHCYKNKSAKISSGIPCKKCCANNNNSNGTFVLGQTAKGSYNLTCSNCFPSKTCSETVYFPRGVESVTCVDGPEGECNCLDTTGVGRVKKFKIHIKRNAIPMHDMCLFEDAICLLCNDVLEDVFEDFGGLPRYDASSATEVRRRKERAEQKKEEWRRRQAAAAQAGGGGGGGRVGVGVGVGVGGPPQATVVQQPSNPYARN